MAIHGYAIWALPMLVVYSGIASYFFFIIGLSNLFYWQIGIMLFIFIQHLGFMIVRERNIGAHENQFIIDSLGSLKTQPQEARVRRLLKESIENTYKYFILSSWIHLGTFFLIGKFL